MYYISLGKTCSIAYNIKKYIDKNRQTMFFDTSRTDFKCVLSVLDLPDIGVIFNIENMILDNKLYSHNRETTITFKNFAKDNLELLYHHDVKYDKNDNELTVNNKLLQFIATYRRRHDRFNELLKTEQKLCFIYNIIGRFDYDDTNLFNSILTKINKNINYILILLIEEHETETYTYCKHDNYVKINLSKFLDKNIVPFWKQPQYKWTDIFELIKTL